MNGPRSREIVQKLWNASKSLQGGGVTYFEYVTELTYLLFLKMLEEVSRSGRKLEEGVPQDCRWGSIKSRVGDDRLTHYRAVLLKLGTSPDVRSPLVKQVFQDAKTSITKPTSLTSLITTIDDIDWYAAEEDGLGDLYEGLLEKTTSERKSKAGQYFTPRALIDCLVRLMKPEPGEIIQDPAAGTGGFLIAAHRRVLNLTDDLTTLGAGAAFFQRNSALQGCELITGTHRLCTMNMLLHGIDTPIQPYDTLSSEAEDLDPADLVLTNPPFNKFPESVFRTDFSITADQRKGPLPFVEHIVRALKHGGRAAVVVPDNVLFEDNTGRRLRTWLMDLCNLHTILRLPTGIFYAQGVKTNVLFLQRGKTDRSNTQAVWVYDMRANMPAFGKTRPLTVADFVGFETAYGTDPNGGAERTEQGEDGRWRMFSRDAIAARNDNLDIAWLRDTEAEAEEALTEPEDIAAAIIGHLKAALEEIEALSEELEPDIVEEAATVAEAAE
ncbi:N-6 DNA methylase [Mesorhizobium sp.]|uniref:class I SAM-dependent DNA methyltransferase n=1 Tax=Mesorhizobium sp. TaxID=1871066 RepID=UPI000FE308BB|nr:N-6 DNA methylase [Mesorhizobium sp.]RWQ14150.1 MAG: SAM-dependent methyltransferase [Mesorhizobium sp.]